jgi:Ca2+-binding EF-hand superfamily protein
MNRMFKQRLSFPRATDLRTAFGLLDRNRDGRVTASELQFMLQNLGIQVRDELIHDLMNEASHSGKGSDRAFILHEASSTCSYMT